MKLARNSTSSNSSSNSSSSPSPQGAGGCASMSPTVGTCVRWSHRNSAFCPVRTAAAADVPAAAEMPFPAVATVNQLMPYGFMNVSVSPYLWPLILPYSPLAASAGCASVASRSGGPGGGGVYASLGNGGGGGSLQQQRLQLQFSPDRASVDAAGQTPEKAKFGKFH